jgi:superfamily II DNA or RNA helicase
MDFFEKIKKMFRKLFKKKAKKARKNKSKKNKDKKIRKNKDKKTRKIKDKKTKKIKLRKNDSKKKKLIKKQSRKISRIVPKFYKSKSENYIDEPDTPCISRSKLPLKRHQKAIISSLRKQRGLIAVHSVGSGKTLTAVTASQCYLDENQDNRVIVVTPTSLQTNFKKELKKYGLENEDRYEFYTVKKFAIESKSGNINCNKIMLIIDEAHNLRTEIVDSDEQDTSQDKNKGKNAKELINCAKYADKVLLLTATPIVNNPYDIENLVSMIEGKEPVSKRNFQKILDNKDMFYSRFACKMSFYSPEEEEYKKYYPKQINHDIFLPMSKKYYKSYLSVEKNEDKDFIISLYGEKDLRKFYNGVRRASNNLEESDSPKINWIISKIQDNESGETNNKFVVFSHFLAAGMKLIKNRLDNIGISNAVIEGSMSVKKRKEIVDLYNSNKIKVLLISKAASEGLDLHETRYMIVTEPSWNETTIKQVIGRTVRYKSHENLPESQRVVDVYKLYLIKPWEKDGEKYIKDNLITQPIKKELMSVDFYLRNYSLKKEENNKDILNRLKEISIEKLECD